MDQIYVAFLERLQGSNEVNLAIYLKGDLQHLQDLKGFLENQRIVCRPFPDHQRQKMQEFNYFDDGFIFSINPDRWTFYEIRSYIQKYIEQQNENAVLRDFLLEESESIPHVESFDEQYYLDLTREIHKYKRIYFEESHSVSLLFSGVLKLIRQNLSTYWVAVRLLNINNNKLDYINFDPPSAPRRPIIRVANGATDMGTIRVPVEFCTELIAEFIVQPGPFSPPKFEIVRFLKHIIMLLDDFIYADLRFKRVTYKLYSELSILKQQHVPARPSLEDREEKTRKKWQLLILAATELSAPIIVGECIKFGFERNNIELFTDFSKFHHFDANNLLVHRCRYDGILVGPMPHKIQGNFGSFSSLIEKMANEPHRYPLFEILRNVNGELVLSKKTLRQGLTNLVIRMDEVGQYQAKTDETSDGSIETGSCPIESD